MAVYQLKLNWYTPKEFPEPTPPAAAAHSFTMAAAAAPAPASATSPTPVFTVVSVSPIFLTSWERETGICSICRNLVEGPCIICQSDGEATVFECKLSWGQCGHAFHTHCITRWLKTRQVCPLDNRPWADKEDWGE